MSTWNLICPGAKELKDIQLHSKMYYFYYDNFDGHIVPHTIYIFSQSSATVKAGFVIFKINHILRLLQKYQSEPPISHCSQ